MKNILLLFSLCFIFFNLNAQNKLRDKNAKYFYNYIFDSIIKLDPIIYKNSLISIQKHTNDFPIMPFESNFYNKKYIKCSEEIYKDLKSKFIVDSLEIANIKNTKKILPNNIFDTSKYLITDHTQATITLSEPMYFSNKKMALIWVYLNKEFDANFLFIKVNKKWKYYKAYCEITY